MLDRFLGGDDGDDGPDEYAILRLTEPREVVERFDADETPPGPDRFEFDEDPEVGVYALREVEGGQYHEQIWKTTVGDPDQRDESSSKDEREIAREVGREVARELGGGGSRDLSLKEAVFQGVLSGKLDPQTAEGLARLNRTWEGGGRRSNVDVDDWDERPLASLLKQATDEPEAFGAIGENLGDAAGSFMDGFYAGGGDAPAVTQDAGDVADGDDDDGEPFDPSVDAGASGFDELGSLGGPDPDKSGDAAAATDGGEDADENDRCAYITADGEQCGNPADDGSPYCWIDSHGPPDREHGDGADAGVDAERIAEELPEDGAREGEPVTDGGRHPLLEGTSGREKRDGAIEEFRRQFFENFDRSEVGRIAEIRGESSPAVRRARKMIVRSDGLAFPDHYDGRRQFLKNLAEDVLSRPDGGGQARRASQPLIEQVALRHLVAGGLILLFVLGGGGGE